MFKWSIARNVRYEFSTSELVFSMNGIPDFYNLKILNYLTLLYKTSQSSMNYLFAVSFRQFLLFLYMYILRNVFNFWKIIFCFVLFNVRDIITKFQLRVLHSCRILTSLKLVRLVRLILKFDLTRVLLIRDLRPPLFGQGMKAGPLFDMLIHPSKVLK